MLLAKVDATEEKSLGEKFGVQGYPTLKIFRKGKATEYKGPRDAAGIVSHMEKQAAPTLTNLATEEAITQFKKVKGAAGAVILGYFSDVSNKLYKTFNSLASTLREDFSFGLISNSDLAKSAKYNNQIVIAKSDGTFKVYDPTEHGLDLESFINSNSFAVGGEYTESNAKRYASTNIPVLKLYIPVDFTKNAKRTLYYQRRLQKLVQNHPDWESQIHFTVANKDTFLRDPSSFGLTTSPEFLIVIEKGSQKYVMPSSETFNVENVEKFVTAFLNSKLESFIKSQEIEDQVSGTHVIRVVGKNFDQIVEDESKNVMIEFYAPWCGHCKTLEPIYEDLAKSLHNKKSGSGSGSDVVIAKLDATMNDWDKEKYAVQGFPTLYWKPKGKGSKIETYNGDREVKAMLQWINSRVGSSSSLDKDL